MGLTWVEAQISAPFNLTRKWIPTGGHFSDFKFQIWKFQVPKLAMSGWFPPIPGTASPLASPAFLCPSRLLPPSAWCISKHLPFPASWLEVPCYSPGLNNGITRSFTPQKKRKHTHTETESSPHVWRLTSESVASNSSQCLSHWHAWLKCTKVNKKHVFWHLDLNHLMFPSLKFTSYNINTLSFFCIKKKIKNKLVNTFWEFDSCSTILSMATTRMSNWDS